MSVFILCVCVHAPMYRQTCVHACGGQRITLAITSQEPITLFSERVSLLLGVVLAGWLVSPRNLSVSATLPLGLEVHNTVPVDSGD